MVLLWVFVAVYLGINPNYEPELNQNKADLYSRCQALISHDLHSTVQGAFIFMCLQTLWKDKKALLYLINVSRWWHFLKFE